MNGAKNAPEILALFTNEISKNYSDYASDNLCDSDICRLVDTDITNGANCSCNNSRLIHTDIENEAKCSRYDSPYLQMKSHSLNLIMHLISLDLLALKLHKKQKASEITGPFQNELIASFLSF